MSPQAFTSIPPAATTTIDTIASAETHVTSRAFPSIPLAQTQPLGESAIVVAIDDPQATRVMRDPASHPALLAHDTRPMRVRLRFVAPIDPTVILPLLSPYRGSRGRDDQLYLWAGLLSLVAAAMIGAVQVLT